MTVAKTRCHVVRKMGNLKPLRSSTHLLKMMTAELNAIHTLEDEDCQRDLDLRVLKGNLRDVDRWMYLGLLRLLCCRNGGIDCGQHWLGLLGALLLAGDSDFFFRHYCVEGVSVRRW